MFDPYSLDSYHYDLPPELIAQYPAQRRDSSRLLVIDRQAGTICDRMFSDLPSYLQSGDGLVLNNTKVLPARLMGSREGGGKSEVFLLRPDKQDPLCWWTLVKPGRKLRQGARVTFNGELSCTIEEVADNGDRRVRFNGELSTLMERIHRAGTMPLPHYIARDADSGFDTERYQTVFAKNEGAVAAPTAGLHFTPELLEGLKREGISVTELTLHVGLGTFRPVSADDIRDHQMHSEWVQISPQAAEHLNQRTSDARQIVVGTTCCRALEGFCDNSGHIQTGEGETNIFIYPGYQFKYVRGLLTNFHLPGSTLLMLVSAFAGLDLMREAYQHAVEQRYRFYSYGDAMLIL